MTPLTTKAAEIRAGLVDRLHALASPERVKHGVPQDVAMTEAAALIAQQAATIEAVTKERDELRDFGGSAVETAGRILEFLGIGQDASKEPGTDRRRDRLAAWIDKAAEARATAESERDSWRRVCERLETEKQAALAERDELLRENERLGEVLRECQRTLAMMVSPEGARQTTVINAFAACVEAEAKARSALENGPAGLADAHSKSPAPSSQSERIAQAVAAERAACSRIVSQAACRYEAIRRNGRKLQSNATAAKALRSAAHDIRARSALAPLGEE